MFLAEVGINAKNHGKSGNWLLFVPRDYFV